MAVNERRLSGRDVLAKTFQTKTKRGYDPVEVDAYLELVAAQIDMLHGDLAAAGAVAPDGTIIAAVGQPEASSAERDALLEEIEALRADRDRLATANAELVSRGEALEAENEQLRIQLTAVAPPPPVAAVIPDADIEIQPPSPPAAVEAEPTEVVPAQVADDRAAEESYELVLRMARRSAEETIAEAHARADEIVADANFTAAQISRESDRKAFEAANKVQAELASMSEDIEVRRAELRVLDARAAERREEMRTLANHILELADEGTVPEIDATDDLRDADSETD